MVKLARKTFIERLINGIEKHITYIGIFAILALVSSILAGAVYALINRVPPMIVIDSRLVVIVPVTSRYYSIIRQTGSETLGMSILLFLGALGGVLMIESSRIVKSQRLLNIVFGIGALLFIVSALLTVIVYAFAKGWGI